MVLVVIWAAMGVMVSMAVHQDPGAQEENKWSLGKIYGKSIPTPLIIVARLLVVD